MTAFDPSLSPDRLEPKLTERQQAVRDHFVNEYMKDFDAYLACIRMGFLAAFAIDQAKIFKQDGYVLRQIAYLTAQSVLPSETDRAAMLANLRWLALNGTNSSRTAATTRYMEAQGYVASAEEGQDKAIAALTGALAEFAEKAPS